MVVTSSPPGFAVSCALRLSLQKLAPDGSLCKVGNNFELLRKALKPLLWYKSGNEAFQLDVSRYVLRTCKPLL